jgi:hypothetical protein
MTVKWSITMTYQTGRQKSHLPAAGLPLIAFQAPRAQQAFTLAGDKSHTAG